MAAMTDAELVARHDGRAPRYTSYPTAHHSAPLLGADAYAAWPSEFAGGSAAIALGKDEWRPARPAPSCAPGASPTF